MDSVTDEACVFIAKVIGNTHIHAQTHVCSASTFLKQIELFPNYNSYSICGFALLPRTALKFQVVAGNTQDLHPTCPKSPHVSLLNSVLFYTYRRWSRTEYGMKFKFLKSGSPKLSPNKSWDEHRTIIPIAAPVLKYKSTLSRLACFKTEAAVRFENKQFLGKSWRRLLWSSGRPYWSRVPECLTLFVFHVQQNLRSWSGNPKPKSWAICPGLSEH